MSIGKLAMSILVIDYWPIRQESVAKNLELWASRSSIGMGEIDRSVFFVFQLCFFLFFSIYYFLSSITLHAEMGAVSCTEGKCVCCIEYQRLSTINNAWKSPKEIVDYKSK